MNTPAILLVTDRDGVRGFIDVSVEAWTPDRPDTLISLSDGGSVRVPTSLLTQLDDVNYFLSCSISDLQPEVAVTSEVVATVPVVEETLEVHKEVHETGTVRVNKTVHVRNEHVEVPLVSQDFEITRVRIDRVVEGVVPVRQEGDTTIYPVLEEVLVVEKRLMLREELHFRVRRTQRVEVHDIALRSEEVTTERSPDPGPPTPPPVPPPPTLRRGETP